MKKMVLAAVFAALITTVFAENVQDEILGSWRVEPFIIEKEDGLLVAPEAVYSHPYLGITGINFIDSSLVVFTVMDVKYRAFYEFESLDFDNYNINCRFKNGEEFTLKIVRIPEGGWKYFYRVAKDSVLTGFTMVDEKQKPAAETHMPETDNLEAAESEPVLSIYTGIMTPVL